MRALPSLGKQKRTFGQSADTITLVLIAVLFLSTSTVAFAFNGHFSQDLISSNGPGTAQVVPGSGAVWHNVPSALKSPVTRNSVSDSAGFLRAVPAQAMATATYKATPSVSIHPHTGYSAAVQVSSGSPTSTEANGGPTQGAWSLDPAVGEDSEGNVYVAWATNTSTGWRIYFSVGTVSTYTFSTPKIVDSSTASPNNDVSPSISVNGSYPNAHVMITYLEVSGYPTVASGDYYFTASLNSGSTFSTPIGDTSNDPITTGSVSSPVGVIDGKGDYLVAFWGTDATLGTVIEVDVYTAPTTYSTYHSTAPLASGAYYVTVLSLGCSPVSADGCAIAYSATNGADTTNYGYLTHSTNEFGTFSTATTLTSAPFSASDPATVAVNVHSVAYSGTGKDAAAAYLVNGATLPTVSYKLGYSYTTNDWTSVTAGTSPAGSTVGVQAGNIVLLGSSGAVFATWVYSGSIFTDAAPSVSSAYGPVQTLASKGTASTIGVTTGVLPWRADMIYTNSSGTYPEVEFSYLVGPSISVPTSSPASVDVGQSVNFTTTAAGGISPYTYSWSPSGAGFGCSSSSIPSLACVPSAAGNYTVSVTMTDANGFAATATSASYTVDSDPAVGIPTAVPSSGSIDQGQNVTFTSALPTGGTGSYSYAWTQLPTGCTNSGTSTVTCAPSASGSFPVSVKVTDSNGFPVTSPTLNYTVNGPMTAKLAANVTVLDLGQSVNLVTTVTGGAGGYTYNYSGLPTGCSTSSLSTLPCTPTSAANASISVIVTDSTGYSATTNTLTLVIHPDPSVSSALTASPNPVTNGSTTTLSVGVTGGTTPYSYAYAGLPSGCSTANAPSLNCTPSASGTFNVTVTATDSLGLSTTSSTSLTVSVVKTPPTITSFSASPSSVNQGQTTTFTVVVTAGTPPYTYGYTGLPGGCSTANSASLTCTPTASGTFTVSVKVIDSNSLAATANTTLTVTVPVSPLKISSFKASPSSVATGQGVTFTVVASGGTPPYSYLYTGLPTGCSTANSATLNCTPTTSGDFTVNVVLTDAGSLTAQANVSLTVTSSVSGPTIASFSASPDILSVGQSSTLKVIVSGGSSPYTYAYAGVPPGCVSQDLAQISCTPTSPGNYTINATVTDHNGKSATKSLVLYVSGQVQPLTVGLSANQSSIPAGSSVLLSVDVKGGVGPYIYTWAINGTNVSYGPDAASWSDLLPHSGNFEFKVWVKDSKGVTAVSSNVPVQVTPPASKNSVPTPFPWWILLVVILAVAIVLIAFVERRRRSSRPPSPSMEEAAAVVPMGAEAIAESPSESPPVSETIPSSPEPPAPISYEPEFSSPQPAVDQAPASEGPAEPEVPPEIEAAPVPEVLPEPEAPAPVEPPSPSPEVPVEPLAPAPDEPAPEVPMGSPMPPELSIFSSREESPAPPSPGADEETLSACPQCGGPLSPERYCEQCGVGWVRDQGEETPEAPPEEMPADSPFLSTPSADLTECPQCGGTLGPDHSCEVCGVVWEPSMSEAAPETEPIAPPEPGPSEWSSEASPSEAPDTESPDVPPPPGLEPSDSVAIPNEEPPYVGRVCLVCGGPLSGDFCSTCNVHWESGGPR